MLTDKAGPEFVGKALAKPCRCVWWMVFLLLEFAGKWVGMQALSC